MATSEWRVHIRGLHGSLPVPGLVQSIAKGRLQRTGAGGGVSRCLFVLPGRQQVRIKVRLQPNIHSDKSWRSLQLLFQQ